MSTPKITPHASPRDLSGSALRAFFRIAELWELSAAQERTLLGNPPESTFFKWKKEKSATLGRDVLERISYVLGIFKALEILLPMPERADAWVRSNNDAAVFAGRSPLDRMLSGNVADLFIVRQYLDANRGWN